MPIKRVDTITTGLGGAPFLTQLFFNAAVGDADAMVQDVVLLWQNLDAAIANDCTMTVQSNVFTIDEVTGQITGAETSSVAEAVPGAAAGEPIALATQGLLRWSTGEFVGGRELRGRMFVPGVTTTASILGRPSSAYQTILDSAGQIFVGAGTTNPVVWSRTNGVFAEMTGWSPWTEFAVLRSRRD